MGGVDDLKNFDKTKQVYVQEVADEGDAERALRHYGTWLKMMADQISFLDRIVISERNYKVIVIYQLKDDQQKPTPTY